jgi:hypothetical protein
MLLVIDNIHNTLYNVLIHATHLHLVSLADADRVALLCCIGALNQKPRAQLLGSFMADMMPRLGGLSRAQLCGCLQALAQLRLTKVDTQVSLACMLSDVLAALLFRSLV